MEMYKLVNKKPVLEPDTITWAESLEKTRVVHKSTLELSVGIGRYEKKVGNITVSTVFLGFDHGFNNEKPILFETMVFGGELDQYQMRCCTWDEALIQHDLVIEKVKNSLHEGVITQ